MLNVSQAYEICNCNRLPILAAIYAIRIRKYLLTYLFDLEICDCNRSAILAAIYAIPACKQLLKS